MFWRTRGSLSIPVEDGQVLLQHLDCLVTNTFDTYVPPS